MPEATLNGLATAISEAALAGKTSTRSPRQVKPAVARTPGIAISHAHRKWRRWRA
jgi:hypothetical protein